MFAFEQQVNRAQEQLLISKRERTASRLRAEKLKTKFNSLKKT